MFEGKNYSSTLSQKAWEIIEPALNLRNTHPIRFEKEKKLLGIIFDQRLY